MPKREQLLTVPTIMVVGFALFMCGYYVGLDEGEVAGAAAEEQRWRESLQEVVDLGFCQWVGEVDTATKR